jgi:phosphohistidine phosphatase
MSRLYLLRHARAAWADPGERDFDRALTPSGHAEAAEIGRAMLASGYLPTRVVCSPARRAVETWQGVAAAMRRKPGEALLSDTLYASDAGGYLTILRNNAGTEALLLIGHNPMIEDLALALSGDGEQGARATLAQGFPTAGLAAFAVEGADVAGASLLAFLTPAEL